MLGLIGNGNAVSQAGFRSQIPGMLRVLLDGVARPIHIGPQISNFIRVRIAPYVQVGRVPIKVWMVLNAISIDASAVTVRV